MSKTILLAFFITLTATFYSQNYEHAVGLKSGYPGFFGVNVKTYKGKYFAWDNTLKSSFNFQNHFIGVYSLLEYNKEFGKNDGYNWYMGAGPEMHYYTKGGYMTEDGIISYRGLFARLDAVFGLEFSSSKTFLNVALDVGPSINLYPFIKFSPLFNISIRYAIKGKKYLEFRQIEPIEKKKTEK